MHACDFGLQLKVPYSIGIVLHCVVSVIENVYSPWVPVWVAVVQIFPPPVLWTMTDMVGSKPPLAASSTPLIVAAEVAPALVFPNWLPAVFVSLKTQLVSLVTFDM